MRDCIKEFEKRVRELGGAAEGELEGVDLKEGKRGRGGIA